MTYKILSIFIVFLFLSSCSEKVHDAEYYFNHQEEMRETLIKCRKNPPKKGYEQNCRSASQAEFKSMLKSKEMPHIK